MASEVEIYNLALGHIGNSTTVATTGERSNEANVCNRFYSIARDTILRQNDWSFLRSFQSLSLVSTEPTTEWNYSYKFPANVHAIKRILSGSNPDTHSSYVRFIVAYGASDREIYMDEQNPVAEVILKDTDTGRYPPDVTMAISYKLAELIAPTLTGGDPWRLQERMEEKYVRALGVALGRDAMENRDPTREKSEFERARES